MQFTTVLIALIASAVSAAPTIPVEVEVEKRACQYVAPNPLGLAVSKGAPQTITFNPPSNAGGPCQLETYFPAGFPIYSSGNAQVNVYAIGGPAPGALVGTVTLASDPNQPTKRVINSFACRPTMQYRFEIAGESGYVYVPAQAGTGLRMSHSC